MANISTTNKKHQNFHAATFNWTYTKFSESNYKNME